MRRAAAVVTITLSAVATLAGCTGGSESPANPPAVTSSGAPSASPGATGAPETDDCHSAGGAELTWGGMVAADDDWAEWFETTWRHSYAFTITSTATELTCRYKFDVAVTDQVTEEFNYGETIQVVLGPGQSWSGEAFYLEEDFEFTADAKDATPKNPLEPEVVRTGTARVFDGYYDADVTFGEVEGEGKDAVLPVTVVQRGPADGMMERLWSATQDVFFVRGLDADGNYIVNVYDWIFPVETGKTETIRLPLGGGPSNGEVMNFHATSAIDKVVTWELAAFQPVLFEDEVGAQD